VYSGSADDRFTIRRLEFAFEEDRPDKYHPKQKYLAKCHRKNGKGNLKTWMVQVVITTPEYLIADDYSELEALDWEVLVVDEAHRLKNHASKLAVNLRNDGFRFGNILCLTGMCKRFRSTSVHLFYHKISNYSLCCQLYY